MVDLTHELLLLKSEAFLFNLKVLETLSIIPGGLIELLFSSLEVGGLELELLIHREQGAEVAVQTLDLKDRFTVLLSDLRVDLFEFLYPHGLIPVPFL